jgi:hypothetical protein
MRGPVLVVPGAALADLQGGCRTPDGLLSWRAKAGQEEPIWITSGSLSAIGEPVSTGARRSPLSAASRAKVYGCRTDRLTRSHSLAS